MGKKKAPYGLGRAEDAVTHRLVGFVFGRRQPETFGRLKALLLKRVFELNRGLMMVGGPISIA